MAHSEMCEFYLRGECRYGVKCWNRHGFEEHYRGQPYLNADTYRRSLQSSIKDILRIERAKAKAAQRNAYNMNALNELLPEQNYRERPDQHTITAPTSSAPTSSAQLDYHYASPAQNTSTISTNALTAQIQVQDLCARPYQSTSTSTNTTNASTAQVQAQDLQLQLEASMRPILKQPGNSKISTEMVANELSAASNFNALHQKKMKESTENHGSLWDDILLSAIDSNLLCNICLEIFIKPTVLNCSHTFCESCIDVWTDRVVACPICRMEVKSKSYCLTLEGFIEKIVEHLPKEIKDKREAAIKDRIIIKRNKSYTNNCAPNRNEWDIARMNLHYRLLNPETSPYNSSTRH